MVDPILHMMFQRQPCCSCCDGNECYADVCVEALALTPEVSWPSIAEPLPPGLAYHQTTERVVKAVEHARQRRRAPQEEGPDDAA